MKYRTKPRLVDAIQWTGENLATVMKFIDGPFSTDDDGRLYIPARSVELVATRGDWIVRTPDEVFPCKPDTFAATYEPAEQAAQGALRRYPDTCPQCNYDRHDCPGCGTPVNHGDIACPDCNEREHTERESR